MVKKFHRGINFLLVLSFLVVILVFLIPNLQEYLYRALILKSEVIIGGTKSSEYKNYSTEQLIQIIRDASSLPAPRRGSWASMDRMDRRSGALIVLASKSDDLALKEVGIIFSQSVNSARAEEDACEIISAIRRSKNIIMAELLCGLLQTHPSPRITQLIISAFLEMDYSRALPILKAEHVNIKDEYCLYLVNKAINRWEPK